MANLVSSLVLGGQENRFGDSVWSIA